MSRALLVVAHGTRSAAGGAECLELAARVRCLRPGLPVAVGNLELADPLIGDSVDALVRGGAREIVAIPLLLFSARHAKHDIPAALAGQQRRHRGVPITYGAPLGVQDELLDLVAERVREVSDGTSSHDTAVALVRAGSTDPAAPTDIAMAAQRLQARHRYLAVEPAFAGIAEPGIDEAVARCHDHGAERIVAVPYLLFSGELVDRVRARADAFAADHADTVVAAARPLGPDPRVAALVLERFDEARTQVRRSSPPAPRAASAPLSEG